MVGDSGDFAIIVPNTKFLMFYNCFGYLYYSICSPREERLGMLLLNQPLECINH